MRPPFLSQATLAAVTSHGTSIAIAATLLHKLCIEAHLRSEDGTFPSPRACLPRLRGQLSRIVKTGSSQNSEKRNALRQAVARAIFADAACGVRFEKHTRKLAYIASEESPALRGEAWRLKVIVRAITDVMKDASEADAREALGRRIWADLDALLAEAVRKRDDTHGGDVEAACSELLDTAEEVLASARVEVKLRVAHFPYGSPHESKGKMHSVMRRQVALRENGAVEASLDVRRCESRKEEVVIAAKLLNTSEREVFVSGVRVCVKPEEWLVPMSVVMPAKGSETPSVEYKTTASMDENSAGEVALAWDVHTVRSDP